MNPFQSAAQFQPRPRRPFGSLVARFFLHLVFLFVALGCLAGYEHFKVDGRIEAAIACLVAAALFGFAPVRDVIGIVFKVEGTALHLVHAVGALALAILPLAGAVNGTPLLTRTAMAPFAIMGAAQAIMHQGHPRNPGQAAAMQRFAASLPEVARLAGPGALSSPASASRAVAAVSDILTKAQALGETELASDPRFRSALGQVSTRFGAGLGLDAVDLVLGKLAANPATASAVPVLRQRLALARRTIAAAGAPRGHS
jgi:hypothetical protein